MGNGSGNDLSMLSIEPHKKPDGTAGAWACYWRANLLLVVVFITILLWVGGAQFPVIRTGIALAVLNTLIFPVFLAARGLWRSNKIFYCIICIPLAGIPFYLCIWGGIIAILGKTVRTGRHFRMSLVICLALLTASCGVLKTGFITVPDRFLLEKHAFMRLLTYKKHLIPSPTPPPSIIAHQNTSTITATPPAPTPTPAPTISAPTHPTPTPAAFFEFRESNGFFSMQLPFGFSHRKEPYRDGTKNLFDYGNSLSLVILISTTDKSWDAEEAMNTKAEAIRQGRAGVQLSRLQLDCAELTPFPSGSGYTLLLSDKIGSDLSMAAMVRVDQGASFSATITCTDSMRKPLFQQILFCLQHHVTIHGKNRTTSQICAAPESAHIPSAATARERICIQGVMEKQGNRTVLINGQFYKVGDRVASLDGTQTSVFQITHIGKDVGSVELEPVQNP